MRVLCGLDLRTDGHRELFAQAARFAALAGARLDVMYAAGSTEAEVNQWRFALDELLGRIPESARGEAFAASGDPVTLLLERAPKYQTLIVGSRPPGGLERLLLGPIAIRILRRSPCPVFVPRVGGETMPEVPIRRLLLGVDLHGPGQPWLINEAAAWAQRFAARLDLLYADPHPLPHIPDAKLMAAAEREWRRGREADRRKLAGRLVEAVPPVQGEALIEPGEAETTMVALSPKYDLALVGTRERPGLTGYLLGSVSEHLVQNAACDVLTLPSAAHNPS